jgi:hypothetical protein
MAVSKTTILHRTAHPHTAGSIWPDTASRQGTDASAANTPDDHMMAEVQSKHNYYLFATGGSQSCQLHVSGSVSAIIRLCYFLL